MSTHHRPCLHLNHTQKHYRHVYIPQPHPYIKCHVYTRPHPYIPCLDPNHTQNTTHAYTSCLHPTTSTHIMSTLQPHQYIKRHVYTPTTPIHYRPCLHTNCTPFEPQHHVYTQSHLLTTDHVYTLITHHVYTPTTLSHHIPSLHTISTPNRTHYRSCLYIMSTPQPYPHTTTSIPQLHPSTTDRIYTVACIMTTPQPHPHHVYISITYHIYTPTTEHATDHFYTPTISHIMSTPQPHTHHRPCVCRHKSHTMTTYQPHPHNTCKHQPHPHRPLPHPTMSTPSPCPTPYPFPWPEAPTVVVLTLPPGCVQVQPERLMSRSQPSVSRHGCMAHHCRLRMMRAGGDRYRQGSGEWHVGWGHSLVAGSAGLPETSHCTGKSAGYLCPLTSSPGRPPGTPLAPQGNQITAGCPLSDPASPA